MTKDEAILKSWQHYAYVLEKEVAQLQRALIFAQQDVLLAEASIADHVNEVIARSQA